MKHGVAKRAMGMALASAMVVSAVGTIPERDMKVVQAAGNQAIYVSSADYYNRAYDSRYAYDGDDLGCTYTATKTTFKVWSPEADSISLNMYSAGSDGEQDGKTGSTKTGTYAMEKSYEADNTWKGVWEYTLEGDCKNQYYTYRAVIGGESYPEAVDPYAKAVGVNGNRGMVVDLDSTDPDNWDDKYKSPKTTLSDAVIWEIDVRDFSISPSSGVSEENRGTYKAFTESTTVNKEGKISSCVDYLKKMGVTHVQILPMFDFDDVDETLDNSEMSASNYNWGYNPKNFNVPDGSYSTDPYDGNVRIKETKEMIQALHDAGIQVVMDVVYNHTYATEDSNFNKIMPDYYYKLTESSGSVSYDNQSGCGNATRCSAAMFEKFMTESLSYWVDEYNIDGFRFDLMGIHDWKTMNNIRKTLDEQYGEDAILMYGEGWTGGGYDEDTSCYKTYCRNLDSGIGYFNDQIRDAIKGETSQEKFNQIGFAQQNLGLENKVTDGEKFPTSVFGGIMGSVGKNTSQWWMWRAYWSDTSARVLSYDSCHDNQTVWDKFADSLGESYDTTSQTMIDISRMSAGYLLTSHGGIFLHAGEEFARTKQGDENSYKSGDMINALDWTRISDYANMTSYYQGMIDIRKAFSGFRNIYTEKEGITVQENTPTGFFNDVNGNNLTEIKNFTDVSDYTVNAIGYYLTNDVEDEWNKVAVLMNNTTSSREVTLEEASQWVLVSNGKKASVEGVSTTEGKTILVPGKSVVVAVPKDTFEQANRKSSVETLVETTEETIAPVPVETQKPVESPMPTATANVTSGGAVSGGAVAVTGTAVSISKLTISPSKYQLVKKPITASVTAIGGIGDLQYRFYVYSGDKIVKSTDWNSSTSMKWTPVTAGTYKIVAKVRDSEGKEVNTQKSLSVIAKKVSVSKLKASKMKVKKGKTITFKVMVSGGKKAYTYNFKVSTLKGKTVKKSGSMKKGTWKWKATKKGTYKVSVTVKDQLGMKATKTVKTIKVK